MITYERLDDIEAEFGSLLKEIGSLENLSTRSKKLNKDFRPFQVARASIQQPSAQKSFQFKKQQRP